MTISIGLDSVRYWWSFFFHFRDFVQVFSISIPLLEADDLRLGYRSVQVEIFIFFFSHGMIYVPCMRAAAVERFAVGKDGNRVAS
jgi:hypothetical protein